MKRVLVYLEPHPVRGSLTEFAAAGALLAQGLSPNDREFEFVLFSNDRMNDYLAANFAHPCFGPTPAESRTLEAFQGIWDQRLLNVWIELLRGEGTATAFYLDVLERLHGEQSFDGIVIWAENGAVRRFADSKGLFVVHGELGSVREPFGTTFYFDPLGTNGNASVRKAPLDILVQEADVKPATYWHDVGLRYAAGQFPRPYVYVPLQLADDTNTLLHSPFSSPEDFVRKVLPPLLAQGFHVVLKGHPWSAFRPYNLAEEDRALAYARSLRSVSILPRDTPPRRTLSAVVGSEFVVTINSSVGYESLLLNKRVLVLGRAVYDIGDKLIKLSSDLSDLASLQQDARWIRKLTTFLSGYYFHPKEDFGPALRSIIELASRREQIDLAWWRQWMSSMDFGFRKASRDCLYC